MEVDRTYTQKGTGQHCQTCIGLEPPGTEEGRETDDNLEKNKRPRAKGSEYVMERGKKTSIESGRLAICSESPMFHQD